MTINQRIKQIRNTKGLSQSKMAEMLGVSLKTYQRYEQDGYKIPERVLRQIEVTFSVNPSWLREGKGEMFLQKTKSNLEFLGAVPFDFVLMPVPVVQDVKAGRGLYTAMVEPSEVKFVWVPKKYVNHRLFFFRVSGDSMKPRLQNGDWVVADLDSSVHNGDLAVVELSNEEIMVKKYRRKREGYLILESYNPDYEPIIVKPEEVKNIAKVVLIVPNGESPWG